MRVILGADHGGYEIKEMVKVWLQGQALQVVDVGSEALNPDDDFVDYAKKAVKAATSSNDRIILFCRNGFGMMIAANRFVGIRCGLGFAVEPVRKGRIDDDINCLSIPSDYVDLVKAKQMIDVFLTEDFSREDRYRRRIMKLDNLI